MAFFSLTFIPQALNLPQLSRQGGWLLYLHTTGSFSLKGARGCVTICRVVELREARTRDQTGPRTTRLPQCCHRKQGYIFPGEKTFIINIVVHCCWARTYFRLDDPPANYDEAAYGTWPRAGLEIEEKKTHFRVPCADIGKNTMLYLEN